jgi:hypothetical protein
LSESPPWKSEFNSRYLESDKYIYSFGVVVCHKNISLISGNPTWREKKKDDLRHLIIRLSKSTFVLEILQACNALATERALQRVGVAESNEEGEDNVIHA